MGNGEGLRFDFVVYYGYSNAFSSGACVIITSEGWKITEIEPQTDQTHHFLVLDGA